MIKQVKAVYSSGTCKRWRSCRTSTTTATCTRWPRPSPAAPRCPSCTSQRRYGARRAGGVRARSSCPLQTTVLDEDEQLEAFMPPVQTATGVAKLGWIKGVLVGTPSCSSGVHCEAVSDSLHPVHPGRHALPQAQLGGCSSRDRRVRACAPSR